MLMTDSPFTRSPLDPKEQPILDRLLGLRDQLSVLKSDRTSYIRTQDVLDLYTTLIGEVEKLNDLRTDKRNEQNRVDTVLDDCFQLVSLFFLTIGRNQEAPAVYSAVSTVKRLLDHLKEAGFYLPQDLESIEHNLRKWRSSVERGKDVHSNSLMTLLEARIDVCYQTLKDLQASLSQLDPQLMGYYEKLVSILRSLSACNTRSKFPVKEVQELEEQLKQIQAELKDAGVSHEGRTAEEAYAERLSQVHIAENNVQEGTKVVSFLLGRCLLWVEIIQEKNGKIDERFRDTYDKLVKLRNTLDNMNLTQAWSLRETDLYSYQRQLDRIDESRVDGNFLDAEGKPADLHSQRTLLYLLRKSYSYIYHYIISSEPVSEALLPIYNQLLTLKRCLLEVKRSGGVDSPRELYPYSMKLNSIDNMKKDGKFMVGDDIPEGQGSVTSLLAECFDIAYDLRNEAEERQDDAESADAAETKE
ncbi:hypothetical protein D6D23_00378 [Aureobasidium pullulans]|uniref:Uncharacterized protein n=1 Tax=Aureobasidium pullulans TaxID=5580 RepID=A0A4S9LJR1_AURPU|nr:hypothetical protein D6D26_08672 [Aureobasidium pullulans]THW30237.1 hypothetical protein D6D23_00378 [Aureobasidium pullulans]THW63876.1 hypothetical protein D6D20_03303 [Aureobasidium pullulans]THY29205.1 hypothetical protein D6D00_03753 [Aureobasidium pullulans]TIA01661.1 hypothetical protein D6C82_03504 [Aureobasidium pullulans]